ncbi:MAG: ATP-binding protein [Spirosomataceae bacterium]
MKHPLTLLYIGLLCSFVGKAQAEKKLPSAKILSVKVRDIMGNSVFMPLDSSQKSPPVLPYDQNSLLFQFVDTQDTARRSFAYLLRGLDYEWITCDRCTQAQYAHLDGGDYSFVVKANEPNAVPVEFNFTVEGNIWHKWWFVPMLFGYFLMLVGIGIYLFVLYGFRQKLKAQRQIHKEKMASMAELTAGIAHEIQNPLNFVNNFSELSVDLISELMEERNKEPGQRDEALENDLLIDLSQNLEKINLHGKRASAIVKGMLEHSRTGTGERQPTDLNALAEQHLRLAYQGLRTNDSSFACDYELITDKDLPKLNVVPQEIGRVLLNLLNNAFYAVQEQGKRRANQGDTTYKPKVTVSIKAEKGQILISVKDNGTGIPEAVKSKIFQPFFTTKPTGEGTGLGLSLTYDIVTKGHGGAMEVESVEGEGTTFIVKLLL